MISIRLNLSLINDVIPWALGKLGRFYTDVSSTEATLNNGPKLIFPGPVGLFVIFLPSGEIFLFLFGRVGRGRSGGEGAIEDEMRRVPWL